MNSTKKDAHGGDQLAHGGDQLIEGKPAFVDAMSKAFAQISRNRSQNQRVWIKSSAKSQVC